MNPTNRPRIIALNIPAQQNVEEVAGNPVITRPESVPANCFPGLDLDVRNLDRRFFPGLIFEFVHVDDGDPQVISRGAQLVAVDQGDPDLPPDTTFAGQLTTLAGMVPARPVFLESLTQTKGDRVFRVDLTSTNNGQQTPFDWHIVWRIVRSLEPGPLIIELSQLMNGRRVFLMKLEASRRTFQTKDGQLSGAYQPGELTQSLCAPWQHDFRDCSCTYWASNHPDIVLAAHPADIAEMDDAGPDQDRVEDPILWMRWDLDSRPAPRPTGDGTRPLEMDTYETNQRWRELNFVLEGREQLTPWVLANLKDPDPLTGDMIGALEKLAGVEQALALEYLYARYTVDFNGQLTGEDRNHAVFIAHELLNVAIGEMMHLRWVNDLLAGLHKVLGQPPRPALKVAAEVPKGRLTGDVGRRPVYEVEWRPVMQRRIDAAIEDFVAAEAPSGTLEGQYATILMRLKRGWPNSGDIHPELIELVEKIIADGVEHFLRFREIEALLLAPDGYKLVKFLENLEPDSAEFAAAKKHYSDVIDGLVTAYGPGGSGAPAQAARKAMLDLDQFAQDLASRGLAIPFLTIAGEVTKQLP